MNFNLKKSLIYQALKWEKINIFKYLEIFSFIALLFSFFLFLLGFQTLGQNLLQKLLGLFLIFFAVYIFSKSFNLFLKTKVQKPNTSLLNQEVKNVADFLTFDAAKVILKAQKTNCIYSLLENVPRTKFIFQRMLLDVKILKKSLLKQKEDIDQVIFTALKIAQKRKREKIGTEDLFLASFQVNSFLKNLLVQVDLKQKDLQNLVEWQERIFVDKERFWHQNYLRKKGSLAKQWTAGYTINLDKYSIDITEMVKKNSPAYFGHDKEIKEIENILNKSENNSVLMIGESGTSRKSIVENLAQKIFLGKSQLNFKRIVELDLNLLTAEIKTQEELEFALNKIFEETVASSNVILVINNFDNFVKTEQGLGKIDISGILSSYLNTFQLQIIGITNHEGYYRYLEKNSSLMSYFEKVEVLPKSAQDTLKILLSKVPFLEKKHKVFVSFSTLKQIIEMTEKYLPSLPFPEKANSVLEETIVSFAKEKIIVPKHVAQIITQKTEIPVGELEKKEKDILLNLEKLIHERLINQDKAIKDISSSLKRARSTISNQQGPMGGFLFLGPTGVGKTETAKALAEIYFGSENKMVRLDMSEFQETSDIGKLIGSKEEPGILTTQVKKSPFSLVLLDELEKANLNILNLFLQVLDEGYLTDGLGKKVDFKNTIIIATSNAGYKIILKAIEEKTEWKKVKEQVFDFLFENGIFKPEFINRFDSVVIFEPLSKENLLDISELLLKKTIQNLEEKGIKLIISQGLKEKIVELSYKPMFGAREMKRVIQDKIENNLANALLKGELKKGDQVKLDPDNFNLRIN